jgi:hypothetical protein
LLCRLAHPVAVRYLRARADPIPAARLNSIALEGTRCSPATPSMVIGVESNDIDRVGSVLDRPFHNADPAAGPPKGQDRQREMQRAATSLATVNRTAAPRQTEGTTRLKLHHTSKATLPVRGDSPRGLSQFGACNQTAGRGGSGMKLHRQPARAESSGPIEPAGSPACRGWRSGRITADRTPEGS